MLFLGHALRVEIVGLHWDNSLFIVVVWEQCRLCSLFAPLRGCFQEFINVVHP